MPYAKYHIATLGLGKDLWEHPPLIPIINGFTPEQIGLRLVRRVRYSTKPEIPSDDVDMLDVEDPPAEDLAEPMELNVHGEPFTYWVAARKIDNQWVGKTAFSRAQACAWILNYHGILRQIGEPYGKHVDFKALAKAEAKRKTQEATAKLRAQRESAAQTKKSKKEQLEGDEAEDEDEEEEASDQPETSKGKGKGKGKGKVKVKRKGKGKGKDNASATPKWDGILPDGHRDGPTIRRQYRRHIRHIKRVLIQDKSTPGSALPPPPAPASTPPLTAGDVVDGTQGSIGEVSQSGFAATQINTQQPSQLPLPPGAPPPPALHFSVAKPDAHEDASSQSLADELLDSKDFKLEDIDAPEMPIHLQAGETVEVMEDEWIDDLEELHESPDDEPRWMPAHYRIPDPHDLSENTSKRYEQFQNIWRQVFNKHIWAAGLRVFLLKLCDESNLLPLSFWAAQPDKDKIKFQVRAVWFPVVSSF